MFCLSVKSRFQNSVQRYKCKVYNKRFQVDYTYKANNSNTNDPIKNLLKEGYGIRDVSRMLNISCCNVLSRMVKISKTIKPVTLCELGYKHEVDEVWSFIGN